MNEDRATRYHRLKRRAAVASLLAGAGLLAALLVSGASVWMRDLALALTAAAPDDAKTTLEVLAYTMALLVVAEVASLPFGFYSGFVLERRYGLSAETLAGWATDRAKSLALGLLLGGAAASLLYAFIRRSPSGWWLPAGLVFSLAIVGLAKVAPVVLLPLFYRVTPLARESLRVRLLALAERAGARVLGAYEWGLGAKTTRANAALAGLGATRRILVSDTMLAQYSDDEIEIVLGHELAHHVHGDIWKGLLFESALLVGGFHAASLALVYLARPLGLSGPADVAGLPLLLLGAGAVWVAVMPLAHALSRAHERSADRFALELTQNPSAFISAMRRLAAQNLAEEQPSKIVQWLFYSHPPIAHRIDAARNFPTLRG